MSQMAVYASQTSIASSLISSSHNNHTRYANRYPNQTQKIGPWKFGHELGRGSTSKVILGVHESTGQQAAIKIVNKNHLDPQELSPSEIDSAGLPYGIQREIIIMKLLDNQNILKLYDVYESKNHLYLITEYVSNGELFDYLVSVDPLPEPQAVRVFYELINGVFFLHNWGIVHRDLKLENILIDHEMHLKIADFGMATLELLRYSNNVNGRINYLDQQNSTRNTKKATNPSTISTTKKVPAFLLETSCGSPHYAAPEVISAEPYNGLKSDMWSCGVIFYALLTGKLPFDDENIKDLLLKVKSGVFDMPTHLSPEAQDLISGLLCLDSEQRLDADGVLKSDLFKKYNIGFYSTDSSQRDYYSNINVFTNSINQNLIKTNTQDHLIINNYNFNKKIRADSKNVSSKILNHLKILYHNKKDTQDILENLVNNKVNIDKVFYSLLVSFDNTSKNYLTNSTKINHDIGVDEDGDEGKDDSDLEESFPAQLHLNQLKMTKAYSNISIIASTSHKRNVSFSHNKKKLVNPTRSGHSLYKSGSTYRYSRQRLSNTQLKSNRSIASHYKNHASNPSQNHHRMKSNKSISSYYNSNYHVMRPSNSIASYNGSLNLSQYLHKNHLIYPNAAATTAAAYDEDDFEDDEDYDGQIEFDGDEPINVVSPGVPVSKVSKKASPIQDLTASYEKLQLEDPEEIKPKLMKYELSPASRDNFDFEISDAKLMRNSLIGERRKQQGLEKEIENALNYSVNYKVSPKRNKRYKTSSWIRNGENLYHIDKAPKSPSKSKSSKSKSKKAKKHDSLMSDAMKASASRRTMKSTLSSKVISNYARVNTSKVGNNNGGNLTFTVSYIDALTTQTKSEFELICDQFFGRSTEKYQSMFGESYLERKAREEHEARKKKFEEAKAKRAKEAKEAALRKQHEKLLELENKKNAAAKAKAGLLTSEEVKLLANNQSLDKNGMFVRKGPVSRLDPGLNSSVQNRAFGEPTVLVGTKPRKSSRANRTTPTSFQSSNESLIFTPSNDIFEPTELSITKNGASSDSKSSLRNFSAMTNEFEYFDSEAKGKNSKVQQPQQRQREPQLLGVAKIRRAKDNRRNSSASYGSRRRRSSRVQGFINDEGSNTQSYFEDNTEDLEDDFEFVTPTSNKFPINNEDDILEGDENETSVVRASDSDYLLYNNVGDSTKDLVRRTLNCELNYKDVYKYSVPEITDTAKSPFYQNDSNAAKNRLEGVSISNPLTQKILNDENQTKPKQGTRIPNSESQAALKAAAIELADFTSKSKKLRAKDAKVKVFVDMKNSNDSSCNLITNGIPGSSRNLALMASEGKANGKHIPVTAINKQAAASKPSRNSSLFRKLSFNSNKRKSVGEKNGAARPSVLSTIDEDKNSGSARKASDGDETDLVQPQFSTSTAIDTATPEPAKAKKVTIKEHAKKPVPAVAEKELYLTLSRTEALVAIKSLLINWKKYGIRDVKVKGNVISGSIKNSNGKVFLKKISSTTSFKIHVLENETGSRLEMQKTKGSVTIFDKFFVEVEKVLRTENVLA